MAYQRKTDDELKQMCPTCSQYFIRVNGNMTYCSTDCRSVGYMKKKNEKWLEKDEEDKPTWKKPRNPYLF